MAVERLTDYTRRIWTGLSADEPDPDMQAGDVIYYMDTSTCSIITGIPAPGSIDTKDLPDVGGGGGGIEIRNVTFRNSIGTNIGVMALALVAELNNQIYYVTAIRGFQANTERTGTFAIQNKRLIISNSSTAWNGLKFRIGSTDLTADYVQLTAPSYEKTYSILLPDDYEETDVIEIYK